VSSINGNTASMSVISADTNTGEVKIRIDAGLDTADGLAGSVYTCSDPETMTCPIPDGIRSPSDYVQDRLLDSESVLFMTLSQIRNLAGGSTGAISMQTRTPDGLHIVGQNLQVPGSNLIIGQLADASVNLASLDSAARTAVSVSITVSDTLQLDGNIVLVLPAEFRINDGGLSNVTDATLVFTSLERPTPAVVHAFDEQARSLTISIGGPSDEFLEAFNKVKFIVTNIRNMVARPVGGAVSQTSQPFLVSTQLHSGAFVETFSVPGVSIFTSVILPRPFGDAEAFPTSFLPGSNVNISIRFSTDSITPRDAIIKVYFPCAYTFNINGRTTISVASDDVQDGRYVLSATTEECNTIFLAARENGTVEIAPQTLIEMNLTNAMLHNAVGDTGVYKISTLTPDGAIIARGVIPSTIIGRPSEPVNIITRNCAANYPEDDPLMLCITWSPPHSSGGSSITGYEVSIDKSSYAFDDKVDTIQTSASVFSARSIALSPGVNYFIRVSASNSNNATSGNGRPGFAAVTRVISLPGAPRAGTLRSDTRNKIFATWFPPQFTGALNPAAEIVAYKVEFSRDENFAHTGEYTTVAALAPSHERSLVSQLLLPGKYYARVSAANMVGFGPPAVYEVTALATPILPVTWDHQTPAEGEALKIQVGYLLKFEIRAIDEDISDHVEVDVDYSLGLPVTAEVLPMVLSGHNGGMANVATRSFLMKPQANQVGLSFEVCFTGRNSNENTLGPSVGLVRCIFIQVVEPVLSWTSGSTNESDGSLLLTPLPHSTFTTFPGCVVEIPLYATAVWYEVRFSYSISLVDFDDAEVEFGQVHGAEIIVPHPHPEVDPVSAVGLANNYSWSALFRYLSTSKLSGYKQKVCFQARDESSLKSILRCVWIVIGSCRACLNTGQTLASFAAEYKSSWLQIWATNPRLGNLAELLAPGNIIDLGVRYKAIGGESVKDVASQLLITVQRLLDFNPGFVQLAGGPDAAVHRALHHGQSLCVVIPVCSFD
jgi:hypothetical protein